MHINCVNAGVQFSVQGGNDVGEETGRESCSACFDGPVAFARGHQFNQMMGRVGWVFKQN